MSASTPSADTQDTRDVILSAARASFAERGYAGSSLRAIARKASVTQPLIYHYFDSKQLLFEAVLDDALARYLSAQSDQWDLPLGDLSFLTTGLLVLFEWLGENEELLRLLTWARLEGYDYVSPLERDILERVQLQFASLEEKGVLRPGTDVEMSLAMIDAMLKGYWDRRSEYDDRRGALDERFLSQCARTLYFGLLTPEAALEAFELFDAARLARDD